MRGAANHFGFKRKDKADKAGANNNGLDKAALEQRNYSQVVPLCMHLLPH